MRLLRALVRDHRWLAMWLVALALCMKMTVPSGFMVSATAQSLSITICDGQGAEQTRQITLPQSGHAHQMPGESGKSSDACPYAGLGMAELSGMPAVLLAVALAFILARGSWPATIPRPALGFFLRPPLRGPPIRG